jgi:hypothetical protein
VQRFVSALAVICLFGSVGLAAEEKIMSVKGKACGTKVLETSGNERIQLAGGVLAHIYLVSSEDNKICYRADLYTRIVESFEKNEQKYVEKALVQSQAHRVVCKDNSGKVLSDTNGDLKVADQSLSLALENGKGILDLKGSVNCPSDVLHLEVQLQ